ncbi:MAG: hypothetical protein GDA36_13965 [Rhodobacteraceae bacterium]|nr:hypothetical protein [Paracoccaceae bacterium]
MQIRLHKQAAATPGIGAAIQANPGPAWQIAERYAISWQTVWKWRKRTHVSGATATEAYTGLWRCARCFSGFSG